MGSLQCFEVTLSGLVAVVEHHICYFEADDTPVAVWRYSVEGDMWHVVDSRAEAVEAALVHIEWVLASV
jgi:hypothetical protein